MVLRSILEQHAGIVMDRQHFLGELLGEHEWGADTESGQFFFDGPGIETPFEVIGTVSHQTGEWLWAWANSSLPGKLAAISRKLQEYGIEHGIERFTQERFAPEDADLHAIGIAACALGDARAYYIADYGDGALLAVFPEGSFMDAWQADHMRVFTVFSALIQMFDLDHRPTLEAYLAALGYEIRTENGLAANRGKDALHASFDAQGRLARLKGGGDKFS